LFCNTNYAETKTCFVSILQERPDNDVNEMYRCTEQLHYYHYRYVKYR